MEYGKELSHSFRFRAVMGQRDGIQRDWSGQGWIYKNPNAFYNAPSQVCYIPELSDTLYTRNDFMKLSLGQPEIAEEMFLSVSWEHPETWLEEQFRTGELGFYPACGRIYESYDRQSCPCGKKTYKK